MNRKCNGILILCLSYFILNSCSPKLTYTQIKEKINESYTSNFVEYQIKNIPIKSLKEYGKDGFEKKVQEIYKLRKNNKYPIQYGEPSGVRMQERNKCNSTYFYKVKYRIKTTQSTPYLDSTALELNYKDYGKENVKFNPIFKILEIVHKRDRILIYDKDRKWKILSFNDMDEMMYNRIFGNGFSECVQSKVKTSRYLNYW